MKRRLAAAFGSLLVLACGLVTGCQEDDLARFAAARTISPRTPRVGVVIDERIQAGARAALMAAVERAAPRFTLVDVGLRKGGTSVPEILALAREGPALDGILALSCDPGPGERSLPAKGRASLSNGYTGHLVVTAPWAITAAGDAEVGDLARRLAACMATIDRSRLMDLVAASISARRAVGLGPLDGPVRPTFMASPTMSRRVTGAILGEGDAALHLPGYAWEYFAAREPSAQALSALLWAQPRRGPGPGVLVEALDTGDASRAGLIVRGLSEGLPPQNLDGITAYARLGGKGVSTLTFSLGPRVLRLMAPVGREADAVDLGIALLARNPTARQASRREAVGLLDDHLTQDALGAIAIAPAPAATVTEEGPQGSESEEDVARSAAESELPAPGDRGNAHRSRHHPAHPRNAAVSHRHHAGQGRGSAPGPSLAAPPLPSPEAPAVSTPTASPAPWPEASAAPSPEVSPTPSPEVSPVASPAAPPLASPRPSPVPSASGAPVAPSPSPATASASPEPAEEVGSAQAEAQLHLSMGRRYLAMDDVDKATSEFKRALALDPNLTPARQELQALLEDLALPAKQPPTPGGQ